MKSIQTLFVIGLLTLTSISYSQKKNNKMTNTETVSTFLNGLNDPTKIATSLHLVADDYKFTNPMVQLNSKTEFIALAQDIGTVLTGLEILNIAEHNNWVSVMYEFKSSIPGLETNLATEWFRLESGLIKESILIYDASEWRKIYASIDKN